jgi:pimeloyl-ACP methyl ester carboxylesterase
MQLLLGPNLQPQADISVSYELPDGLSQPIGVQYHCVNTPNRPLDHRGDVIVSVNGWTEDKDSFEVRNSLLLAQARARGEPCTVVNYSAACYRQDDQNEALVKVVDSLPWDAPVIEDTHSRGGITGVQTAPALLAAERLKGLVIGESCGYSDQDLTPQWFLRAVVAELSKARLSNIWSQRQRTTLEALGHSFFEHVTRHPLAARREVAELIAIDTTQETIDLAERLPLMVITGLRDQVCPSAPSMQKLAAAHLPLGRLVALDMTHVSPLLHPGDIRQTHQVLDTLKAI